jgi:hypothetical protein
MNRQPQSASREAIVEEAIKDVVGELRLVDAADYVAFIRLEHFSTVSDLVESAAELFFAPGTLKLGHGGEAHVTWSDPPRIVLDLELRPAGATVYFALTLEDERAAVVVNYVAFEQPDPDPLRNTAYLADAIERSRIRRTEAACAR